MRTPHPLADDLLIMAVRRYGLACRIWGRAMEKGDVERVRQATKAESEAFEQIARLRACERYDPKEAS